MFEVARRRRGVSIVIVERIDYDDDAAARRLYGGAERACFCLRASCDDAEPQEGAEQCSCKPFFIQHMTQLLLSWYCCGRCGQRSYPPACFLLLTVQ